MSSVRDQVRSGDERYSVALGPVEVAGVVSALAKGLRERGDAAQVVLAEPHPFGYPGDLILSGRPARIRFSLGAPGRFDVLHYHFGDTWAYFADAIWARLRRRLRVMHYHGDDVRLAAVARLEHPHRARNVNPKEDRPRRRRLRLASLTCQAAVVGDLELLSYVRPYFKRIYLVPLAVDVDTRSNASGRAPGPLRVLHAPSVPAVKGTAEIERALRNVADRIEIEWAVLAKRPHAEVLAAIERADVVVDQLNSENYGALAIEAMARGKPVLAELDRAKLGPWATELPVVGVTAQTLEERIEEIAEDGGARERLGEEGRRFVEAVHAPARVAACVVQMYRHIATRPPPGIYATSPDRVEPLDAGQTP